MSIKIEEDGQPTNPVNPVVEKSGTLKKAIVPILLVLIIGVVAFLRPTSKERSALPYKLGAKFDKEKFLQIPQYEPLLAGATELPVRASLKGKSPIPGDQGQQGSCVGWAAAYGAQSILIGYDNRIAFSPAYLFNQIALENCEGSFLSDAMEGMRVNGGLHITEFPYDDNGCGIPPSDYQIAAGKKYAITNYQRLTNRIGVISPNMMKEQLAAGNPIVIGMIVPGSFIYEMDGKNVWQSKEKDDFSYGGHALCVVAYDDEKYGGAFQVMNSWGEAWGNSGYAWITYSDFREFGVESYSIMKDNTILPAEKVSIKANITLAHKKIVKMANEELANSEYEIPIKKRTYYYQCQLKKGDRFKVFVENDEPLYLYVFAEQQETGVTVIYPYSNRHSDYISTAGKRVFPDNYNFRLDDIGEYEQIAILLSKESFNYNSVEIAANAIKGSFFQRLEKTLEGVTVMPKPKINGNKIVVDTELDDYENSVLIPIRVRKK